MALSFEDSLKASQVDDSVEANMAKRASVMAVSLQGVAGEDDGVAVLAESDVESWLPVEDQGYDFYDEYSDDNVSTIDEDKNINLHPKQFNITKESNSQYIPFEMPRYYDGFDLVNTKLYIRFVTSNGLGGVDCPVNVYYNDEKIKFAWLVDNVATQVAGTLRFEIQAKGVNSKDETYLWKSKINENMTVLQSLEIQEYISPPQDVEDMINEKISAALLDYYTSEEIDGIISNVDVSDQIADIEDKIENLDGLSELNVTYDGTTMTFYNGESVIDEFDMVDTGDETDAVSKDEIDSLF